MKGTQEGRPSSNKKPIDIRSLEGDIVHVPLKLSKELHRKIAQRKLDTGIGIIRQIMDLIEKEYK
jgi:hypothetical protein